MKIKIMIINNRFKFIKIQKIRMPKLPNESIILNSKSIISKSSNNFIL